MPDVRHRSHRKPNGFSTCVSQYRFEIIWLAVVALGVFLVFERLSIRSAAQRWVRNAAAALLRGAGRVDEIVGNFLARATLSDAIGYLLILGALVAIVLRMRWRLMHSLQLTALQCPKCGSDLHRVHRHRIDHLVSVLVPVRRYRCAKRECGWQGIRVTAPKSLPTSSSAARG